MRVVVYEWKHYKISDFHKEWPRQNLEGRINVVP